MSRANRIMNCEEYREAISADPAFDGGARHLSACVDCRDYGAEMRALNVAIASALQISVPELRMPQLPDIEASVENGNIVPLLARRAISKPIWFALAATVLVAALIGVRMAGNGVAYPSLEEQVLAHVDHEQAAFEVTGTPVSDHHLARVVPANIAELNHDAGMITYARSCSINGRSVPHLVIQGERGPITILLMPEESVTAARILEGRNVRGIILPVGSGSIAIIGDRDEQLDRVTQNILHSVDWST